MIPPFDERAYLGQRFAWIDVEGEGSARTSSLDAARGGALGIPPPSLRPLLFLPFHPAGEAYLAFAAPEVGINFLSTFRMTGLALHYHYVALPAFFVGTARTAGALPEPVRRRLRGGLLAALVASALLAQNSPFSANLLWPRTLPEYGAGIEDAKGLLSALPREGSLAVFGRWRLLPRLWDRDVAIEIPYAGRTDETIRDRDLLVYDGVAPSPEAVRGRVLLYRSGDVALFGR